MQLRNVTKGNCSVSREMNQDRRPIRSPKRQVGTAASLSIPAETETEGNRSEALLALVKVAILADAGNAQAGHASPINGALPSGEFFECQAVALARFIDAEQAAAHGGDDFCLAANHPSRGLRRRKGIERQGLAKRANDSIRSDGLILFHANL
jgi:hypothetical protein